MQFLLQQFRKAKPQGVSYEFDLPLHRQTCILFNKTVLYPKKGTSDSYEIPPAALFDAQRYALRLQKVRRARRLL